MKCLNTFCQIAGFPDVFQSNFQFNCLYFILFYFFKYLLRHCRKFIYLFYFWLCWVFISVRGLSPVAASGGHSSSRCAGLSLSRPLVAEHRLQTHRLSSCGSRAQLLRGTWDLPRPGLEPVSPALAGRFSTTASPGKPSLIVFKFGFNSFIFSSQTLKLIGRNY